MSIPPYVIGQLLTQKKNAIYVPPASAALSVVQARKGLSGGANNVAVSISPTSGNLLVFFSVNDTAAISSVSDNIDGTTGWTSVFSYHPTSTFLTCYYKKNIPAGITAVTVTATGGSLISAIFHEVAGASTTAPFTTGEFSNKNNNSNSTNQQTNTLSNATANSIMFACCDDLSSSSNPTQLDKNGTGTVGTWTLTDTTNSQELNNSTADAISVLNLIVSSTANQIHGWTTGNGQSTTGIVAFH